MITLICSVFLAVLIFILSIVFNFWVGAILAGAIMGLSATALIVDFKNKELQRELRKEFEDGDKDRKRG